MIFQQTFSNIHHHALTYVDTRQLRTELQYTHSYGHCVSANTTPIVDYEFKIFGTIIDDCQYSAVNWRFGCI